MISSQERKKVINQALLFLQRASISITPAEREMIETADFALGEIAATGLEVLVYVNTDRYCAKEIIMLPRQTCPEHRHPSRGSQPGKMETFRCRWGIVYLYIEGEPTPSPEAKAPKGREATYTVWHEIILRPGEQFTLPPNTLHWFQSGDMGAVVSEFSSPSDDASDIFTDPEIQRITKVGE